MPKYVFECQNPDCGLTFDLILKMGPNLSHACSLCHEQAPRLFKDQGFAFAFETPKAKEGNSGVHKDDYPTADHAVGRDADRRWVYYGDRAKVKEAARAGGGTPKLRRVDGPGWTEYETLTPTGAVARRETAHKAVASLLTHREEARARAKQKAR
jgi:hypothetical protein